MMGTFEKLGVFYIGTENATPMEMDALIIW